MILTSGHNLQSNHFGTCVEEFEAFGVVVFSLKKQQLETGGTGGKKVSCTTSNTSMETVIMA